MIIIRSAQMQALQHSIDQRFLKETFFYLQNNYKPILQSFTDEDAIQLMSEALEKARSYGFFLCKDLRSFIVLAFIVSRDFDLYPSINSRLANEQMPIEDRMHHLFDTLPEREWRLAKGGDSVARATVVSAEAMHELRSMR